jgi:hypothetical protein
VDGQYEIRTDDIRALAIQCHALDVAFDVLFNEPTICRSTEAISRTYNRLLSTGLLNLAIAIRVSLADEPEYSMAGFIAPAALFLEGWPQAEGFSIKDICDKIIHARRIYKPTEEGVRGAACELSGQYRGQKWTLGLGVGIFCEYVLGWLDQLDQRKQNTTG